MVSLYVKITYDGDRNLIKWFPFMLEPLTMVTGITLNGFPSCKWFPFMLKPLTVVTGITLNGSPSC